MTTQGIGGWGAIACNCFTSPGFVFDDAATPDTIVAGNSITVTISGGCWPYTWTVSGTGYSLDFDETSGTSNTLNCAAGTCKVNYDPYCVVYVTDTCGSGVNFTILNSAGSWVWLYGAGMSASCTGPCACAGGPFVNPPIYHQGTGTGNAYLTRWDVTYYTGCNQACDDNSWCGPDHLVGATGGACGTDILYRNETDMPTCAGDGCWGSANLYFWICGTC